MSVKPWIASLSDSSDYRSAMRRVGVVAILVGVIDTIAFIIAIINRQSYSTSLSIFAVIAGISLIRGNLNTCLKVSRWIGFTGGGLFGSVGALLVAGVLAPPLLQTGAIGESLKRAQHLDRIQLLIWLLCTLIYAGLLVWAFRTLTSGALLTAMRSSGLDCDSFFKRPITSFFKGVALGVAIVILVIWLQNFQPT